MNKDTMKQYAMHILVIAAILIVAGSYQAVNPVLAVSAHDDRADMHPMLATTTFAVEGIDPTVSISGAPSGSVQEGTPVDITCTWDYGTVTIYDKVYLWDTVYSTLNVEFAPVSTKTGSHTFNTAVRHVDGDKTAKYHCYLYTAEGRRGWVIAKATSPSFTITDTPAPPPQIDDTTDTLTTDKTSYSPGEGVWFTATGTNVGGQTWTGKVHFRITSPFDSIIGVQTIDGINPETSSTARTYWTIPVDAPTGTYTIQSKWIDNAGTVHAMSTIDLGTATVAGIDINVLGIFGVLLGLLLGGIGLRGKGWI